MKLISNFSMYSFIIFNEFYSRLTIILHLTSLYAYVPDFISWGRNKSNTSSLFILVISLIVIENYKVYFILMKRCTQLIIMNSTLWFISTSITLNEEHIAHNWFGSHLFWFSNALLWGTMILICSTNLIVCFIDVPKYIFLVRW